MIEIAAGSSELPAANAANGDLPHVLLVVDQFSKTLGGAERIILRLGALLPSYGFRASILTLSIDPTIPELKSPPCPIYLLPIQRTYDLTALRAALDLRQFLEAAKRQDRKHFLRELRHLGWPGYQDNVKREAGVVPQRHGNLARAKA